MQVKFTCFFPAFSRSFFTENLMVDPCKNEENQEIGPRNSADAERAISGFVAYRTSILPFFLRKDPALLVIKLVTGLMQPGGKYTLRLACVI